MFVGEAPGATRTSRACRSSAAPGKLLDQLLEEIGLARDDVFIANVLKCRPPGNRDPQPEEIEACKPYLDRKIELIEPKVICTLGNFATKLLTRSPRGHHAGPRAPAGARGRRAARFALPALPPGRGAADAARARAAARRTSRGCPPCWPSRRRVPLGAVGPVATAPAPRPQLDLFG